MGDVYVGLVDLDVVTLALTGDATVTPLGGTSGTYVANASIGCMSDRCLLAWENWNTEDFYEVVIAKDGTATAAAAIDTWGTAGIATDGTSFFVTGDGIVTVAPDGTVGARLAVNADGAIAWGGGEYLVTNGSTLTRLSSSGAPIGVAETAPSFAGSAR